MTDPTDPLAEIFGRPALELFRSPELVVQHGRLERFPEFMRTGVMESVETLCRSYSGALEVAKGSVSDGLQTGVSGVHASALLKLGLTVFFPDLRRALPKEAPGWLRRLEASLGLPECTSLMAFANAPGSGLSLHHDRYDQLFFQIRGQKQFRFASNGYVTNPDMQFSPFAAAHIDFAPSYRHGFPLTSEEVLARSFQTIELDPGSAFFNRGHLHWYGWRGTGWGKRAVHWRRDRNRWCAGWGKRAVHWRRAGVDWCRRRIRWRSRRRRGPLRWRHRRSG